MSHRLERGLHLLLTTHHKIVIPPPQGLFGQAQKLSHVRRNRSHPGGGTRGFSGGGEVSDTLGMALTDLDVQIAGFPPEAQAIIRGLLAEVAALKARLAEVEGRKTPQNSSLPPSTQHPHAKPKRKAKSKKKRGGQPGHPKHQRPLLPTEQCEDVIPLKPIECRRCGTQLVGVDAEPLRHQVWEVPEIKPLVTEYQRHRLVCGCCGETTCAALPADVPTGQSGPRLIALTGLLMAHFRQSKRRTALFLQDLLGQPCSASLTVKMQQQMAQALETPYQELLESLPATCCESNFRASCIAIARKCIGKLAIYNGAGPN